jgi:hypothetical protein
VRVSESPLYEMSMPLAGDVSGRRMPVGRPMLSKVYVYVTNAVPLFCDGSGTVTATSSPVAS